jgi:hypothetical protein
VNNSTTKVATVAAAAKLLPLAGNTVNFPMLCMHVRTYPHKVTSNFACDSCISSTLTQWIPILQV